MWPHMLVALLAVGSRVAQAQSSNPFGNLISDAVSVFTEATSVLAPVYTRLSSEAAGIMASAAQTILASSTSSSSSPPRPGSSSTSSTATPTSTLISPSAAATLPTDPSPGGGHHRNDLSIILGSVLGALCFALLVGLLSVCLYRRRRRSLGRYSSASSAIGSWRRTSAQLDESDQRRLHGQLMGRHLVKEPDPPMSTVIAPKFADHPAFCRQEDNPFAAGPPPSGWTVPSRRAGLSGNKLPRQSTYANDGSSRGIPLVWTGGSTKGSRPHFNSISRKPVPSPLGTELKSDEAFLGSGSIPPLDTRSHALDDQRPNFPSSPPSRMRFPQDFADSAESQLNLACGGSGGVENGQLISTRSEGHGMSGVHHGLRSGVGDNVHESNETSLIGQAW